MKKFFVKHAFFSLTTIPLSFLLYPMESPRRIECNIDTLCSNPIVLRHCFNEQPIEQGSGEPLVVVILNHAAEHGLLTVFTIAKECKIPFDQIKNKKGLTPLHFAAHNNSKNIVQFLLNEKVEVDPLDNEGRTPFLLAIVEEYFSVALLLLNSGANIDHTSALGTALTLATNYHKKRAVKFLLKHNANPHVAANPAGVPGAFHTALKIAQVIAPNSSLERLLRAYTNAPEFGVCAYCKKDNCEQYCAECKTVYYCSQDCQFRHKTAHVSLCADIKSYLQSIT